MEDEESGIPPNSEARFLALELMKIAEARGVPFRQVLEEFISNVYELGEAIEREAAGGTMLRKQAKHSNEAQREKGRKDR